MQYFKFNKTSTIFFFVIKYILKINRIEKKSLKEILNQKVINKKKIWKYLQKKNFFK